MLEMEAVEIGSGSPVECSRRLLSVVQGGNPLSLKRELVRAGRVSGAPVSSGRQSSLIEEQKELLGAIVERMHVSMQEHGPCADAEIFLLGHLAGSRSAHAISA